MSAKAKQSNKSADKNANDRNDVASKVGRYVKTLLILNIILNIYYIICLVIIWQTVIIARANLVWPANQTQLVFWIQLIQENYAEKANPQWKLISHEQINTLLDLTVEQVQL